MKHEQVVPSLHSALTFTASTSNLMLRRHQDMRLPYLPWQFVLQYDHPHRYILVLHSLPLQYLPLHGRALKYPINVIRQDDHAISAFLQNNQPE